jgi:hypothetical protein
VGRPAAGLAEGRPDDGDTNLRILAARGGGKLQATALAGNAVLTPLYLDARLGAAMPSRWCTVR